MDKKSILRKFEFYKKASNALKAEIFLFSRVSKLSAGEYGYHQGEKLQHFFLLGSGRIRLFRLTETGRRISLYYLREGETCLINMLSVFLNNESSACALAETDVRGLIIPAVKFRAWVRSEKILQDVLFQSMSGRVMEVLALVERIAFGKMDERLANFLLQRFQNQRRTSRVIRTTHEEIAAELGSAREVISRTLKDFERIGAIKISRGRIQLLSEDILREWDGSQ